MMNKKQQIEFNKLYKQFMSEEYPFKDTDLCKKLFLLTSLFEDPREIKDPENEKRSADAFVCIKDSSIYVADGRWVKDIESGDVIVLQHAWDRNIIVTHIPLNTSTPIPFFLKDPVGGTGLKGVWLPIFDSSKIPFFVHKKVGQIISTINSFVEKERRYWDQN